MLKKQKDLFNIYGYSIHNTDPNLSSALINEVLKSEDFKALKTKISALQPLAEQLFNIHKLKELQLKKKSKK